MELIFSVPRTCTKDHVKPPNNIVKDKLKQNYGLFSIIVVKTSLRLKCSLKMLKMIIPDRMS